MLRRVEIVNIHDIRGAEVNFFCHVLDDAHDSCKAAVSEEVGTEKSPVMIDKALQTNVLAKVRNCNGRYCYSCI